jgi:hypothetical protein
MKKSMLAILLCSTSVAASEIEVDLNNLSNISKVGTDNLSIISEFNGYELSGAGHRKDIQLAGLDWQFFYGVDTFVEKPNSDKIGGLTDIGSIKHMPGDEPVHANRYSWDGGSYADYAEQFNHAMSLGDGGFSFNVKAQGIGRYKLDLYTHNWLSSADVTACIKQQCVTIKNDITTHMTGIQNSIVFNTSSIDDQLIVTYKRVARQWDYSQSEGYHSLEAINLSEVK